MTSLNSRALLANHRGHGILTSQWGFEISSTGIILDEYYFLRVWPGQVGPVGIPGAESHCGEGASGVEIRTKTREMYEACVLLCLYCILVAEGRPARGEACGVCSLCHDT